MANQNATTYYLALQNHKRKFEHDGDKVTYLANSFYTAANMFMDENPELKGYKPLLAANKHIFKGAIQTLAHKLTDPHPNQTHESFLDETWRHAREGFDKDIQALKDFLAKLGIG